MFNLLSIIGNYAVRLQPRLLLAGPILAALTLAAPGGAARADMVYTFVQTGQTGPWPGTGDRSLFPLTFELTDAAVAAGSFSLTEYGSWEQTPYLAGSPGLVSFSDWATPLAITGRLSIDLTFNARGGIARGSIGAASTQSDYLLTGTPAGWSGSVNSDFFPWNDCQGTSCTLAGYWQKTEVAVAEPGTLPLVLTAALGGFLAKRRRRPS